MNLEKKAKLKIGVSFILMIVLTITCFIILNNKTANAEEKENIFESVETLQVDYTNTPTYKEEGYKDLKSWWESLQESRTNEANKLQADIDAANGLSEEQLDELDELKNKIAGAESFSAIEDYKENADKILSEAKPVIQTENSNNSVSTSNNSSATSGSYSGSYYDFLRAGVVNHNGNKFTYYSQSVLPGGGLNIPGRHVSGGFVCDGDGYIVLANSAANGTVVNTPWGAGKVYDKGTNGNHYDVYVE